MKRVAILAPLALLAVPFVAGSASADEVTITKRTDSGLHRGWDHAPAYGARKVVIKKRMGDLDSTSSTRVTKKITKTNAYGDRVTKKVTREAD